MRVIGSQAQGQPLLRLVLQAHLQSHSGNQPWSQFVQAAAVPSQRLRL